MRSITLKHLACQKKCWTRDLCEFETDVRENLVNLLDAYIADGKLGVRLQR